MSKILVIEQEHLDKLFTSLLDEFKKAIESKTNTSAPKTDWITLEEFYDTYKVSKSTWYDKYKKIIKWRDDGKIWVYKPSFEAYLMDKSIN